MAGKNYDSYFTTGPRLRGEGNKNFVTEYITIFGKTLPDASAYIQYRWDWANSSDTSKWSSEQQCYSVNRANRDLSRKRILIRGSGPALQIHIRSQAGKPFNIAGWAAWDTADVLP